jgi:predicted metal-dependent TIM-barrel fold hydrolase
VLDTPPLVKKNQQIDNIEYNMDLHELGDSFERETVQSGPASVLHYPYPTFDLRYVLVDTCHVDHMETWNGFNQGLERREFTVGMHLREIETMLEIVLVHLLEILEYLRNNYVREVVDIHETYLTTKCQEERNIVH